MPSRLISFPKSQRASYSRKPFGVTSATFSNSNVFGLRSLRGVSDIRGFPSWAAQPHVARLREPCNVTSGVWAGAPSPLSSPRSLVCGLFRRSKAWIAQSERVEAATWTKRDQDTAFAGDDGSALFACEIGALAGGFAGLLGHRGSC